MEDELEKLQGLKPVYKNVLQPEANNNRRHMTSLDTKGSLQHIDSFYTFTTMRVGPRRGHGSEPARSGVGSSAFDFGRCKGE